MQTRREAAMLNLVRKAIRPGPPAAIWAVIVAAATLGSCRPPDELDEPTVEVRGIAVRHYSGGMAGIELEIAVSNPNGFEISMTGVECDLAIGGAPLGSIAWSGEVTVGAGDAAVATLPAELRVGEHARVYSELIDRRPLAYEVAGRVSVAHGLFKHEVPFETGGELNPGDGGSRGRTPPRHAR